MTRFCHRAQRRSNATPRRVRSRSSARILCGRTKAAHAQSGSVVIAPILHISERAGPGLTGRPPIRSRFHSPSRPCRPVGSEASAVLPALPRGLPASSGVRLHCSHAALSARLHHHIYGPPQVSASHSTLTLSTRYVLWQLRCRALMAGEAALSPSV